MLYFPCSASWGERGVAPVLRLADLSVFSPFHSCSLCGTFYLEGALRWSSEIGCSILTNGRAPPSRPLQLQTPLVCRSNAIPLYFFEFGCGRRASCYKTTRSSFRGPIVERWQYPVCSHIAPHFSFRDPLLLLMKTVSSMRSVSLETHANLCTVQQAVSKYLIPTHIGAFGLLRECAIFCFRRSSISTTRVFHIFIKCSLLSNHRIQDIYLKSILCLHSTGKCKNIQLM